MIQMTKDQKQHIENAQRFAKENSSFILENGDRIAQAKKLYNAYAGAGYHAMLIPERCGGGDLDYTSAGLIYETLSYHMPATLHAPITTAHCAEMIKSSYQDTLIEKYLKPVAADGLALGFCLTEEHAGSDITAITTTAEKSDGGYVVNGKKSIVINHAIASSLIVFATISPGKGRAGINAFVVNPDLPGVHIADPYEMEGISGCVIGEVSFKNVHIGSECLLGEEGSGYFLLMETLDKGRPLVAASCTGSAKKVFDITVTYAKQRQQFGNRLFSFQGVSLPLSEYATRLHASELLYIDALQRIDTGQSFSMEASMAKLFASQTLIDIASFSMDILGYRGATEMSEVRKVYHDAHLMKSIDGTANVQKMVIASQL